MDNLWELYQDELELSYSEIQALKDKGYEILERESAQLTGYFIKNEVTFDGVDFILARHESEDGEELPW